MLKNVSLVESGKQIKKGKYKKIRNKMMDHGKRDDYEYQGVGEGKRKKWFNSKTQE